MKLTKVLVFSVLLSIQGFSQTAEEYYEMAYEAFDVGDVVNQIQYAEKAISLFDKSKITPDSYFYSTLLAANGYLSQQNYQKAAQLLENATLKMQNTNPDLKVALLNNLVLIYSETKNNSKLEKVYLQLLDVTKTAFGRADSLYIATLKNLGDLYQFSSDPTKAEYYYIEAFNIVKQTYDRKDPDYREYLQFLAQFYYREEKYSKAEPLLLDILQIFKDVYGSENPNYATTLNNLASLYKSMGNAEKAESLYLEAIAIRKKILGNQHPDYANSLSYLGEFYMSTKNFSKAEPLFVEALMIRKNVLGKEHPDYIKSLFNLALLYFAIRKDQKSESLFFELVSIPKRIINSDHFVYKAARIGLAKIYFYAGKFSKAKPLLLEIVEVLKHNRDSQELELAEYLSVLGRTYIKLGQFDSAEDVLLESLGIIKNTVGIRHIDYANNLSELGQLYTSQGNYAKAESVLLEALNLQTENKANKQFDYAMISKHLANFYKEVGKYLSAEVLYIEALEVLDKEKAEDTFEYAGLQIDLAGLYKFMGKYSKSEILYLQSTETMRNLFGPDHIDYGSCLHNLADLYLYMGIYSKAEALNLKALEIAENTVGIKSTKYLQSLANLAMVYEVLDDFAKAELLALKALEIEKEVQGSDNVGYSYSLSNMGVIYTIHGKYLEAMEVYKEALEIQKRILGYNHPFYALTLENLADLYEAMGDFPRAESLFTVALAIRKDMIGKEHPNYISNLHKLAGLKASNGENDLAVSLYTNGLSSMQKLHLATFASLSESEKTLYSKKNQQVYHNLLSSVSLVPNAITDTIYNIFLFRKGLILNSSINTRSFIQSSTDERLKQKYADWLSTKQVINNLYSKTIEQRKNSGYDLDSLEELANTLEKELSRMSSTFEDFVMIPDFKWEDIRKNLKPGEAVVDLVKYRLYDKRWTDTTRYGVFITKSDLEEPVYFEFKDGNRIDTLVIPKLNETNKNKFADASKTEEEDANVIMLGEKDELDFYSELFAPMAEHLNGVKKIYFSLDGEFYKVNFSTLRNPATGKYLIEDYEIVYVSSANEIARGKRETPPNKTAVLTGFPNYDLSLDSLTALVKAEQTQDQSRDVYVNTSKIKQYNIELLPGTKDEVTVTGDLLKKNGWEVSSWLFNDATESKVKSISAPGLLSISTHGFFSPSPKTDYSENYFMGTETKKAVENPLLRSGLFLTGAETFLNSDDEKKEEFKENGILTAYEASQMKLLGTDLVILSACETGLGEVNNGEGVFGLQRGFFGAGAKSVLMSLWKVDDTATKDLMIEFIKNYSTTMNKQKSLRDAQLTIMKKYPQPYYWGAFVMVGM